MSVRQTTGEVCEAYTALVFGPDGPESQPPSPHRALVSHKQFGDAWEVVAFVQTENKPVPMVYMAVPQQGRGGCDKIAEVTHWRKTFG